MFYSQFILAKKGPLGTIWIAAHLERKLRKNQVAETDIGVTVDSILFPEVPIALRLSGHLLLGVVRIYSRQVNYLFNDCSETLGKIKQAFHSAAVDLPPEATTAPFHTITLPETFDFDELELVPDSESSFLHLNGNFVDQHVTTREQITLQDTVDHNPYLGSSQFGLDERFGDGGYVSLGFDFDEDFLADKARSASGASTSSTLPKEDRTLPPVGDESNSELLFKENVAGPSVGCEHEVTLMEIDNHHEPVNSGCHEVDLLGERAKAVLGIPERDNCPNNLVQAISIDRVIEHADVQVAPRKELDFTYKNHDTPGFQPYTPRALEACTPDLNQEYCPPDEPSTPALVDETSLPMHKEFTVDNAGRISPSFAGHPERIVASETLPGSLPAHQIPSPWASSTNLAIRSPSSASFQGFTLQQAANSNEINGVWSTESENVVKGNAAAVNSVMDYAQGHSVKENAAAVSTAFPSFAQQAFLQQSMTDVLHEGSRFPENASDCLRIAAGASSPQSNSTLLPSVSSQWGNTSNYVENAAAATSVTENFQVPLVKENTSAACIAFPSFPQQTFLQQSRTDVVHQGPKFPENASSSFGIASGASLPQSNSASLMMVNNQQDNTSNHENAAAVSSVMDNAHVQSIKDHAAAMSTPKFPVYASDSLEIAYGASLPQSNSSLLSSMHSQWGNSTNHDVNVTAKTPVMESAQLPSVEENAAAVSTAFPSFLQKPVSQHSRADVLPGGSQFLTNASDSFLMPSGASLAQSNGNLLSSVNSQRATPSSAVVSAHFQQQGLPVGPYNSQTLVGVGTGTPGFQPPSMLLSTMTGGQGSIGPFTSPTCVSPSLSARTGSYSPMENVLPSRHMEHMAVEKNSAAIEGSLLQPTAQQCNASQLGVNASLMLPMAVEECETLRSAYNRQDRSASFPLLQEGMSHDRMPGLELDRNKFHSHIIGGATKEFLLPEFDKTPGLRVETPFPTPRTSVLSIPNFNSIPGDDDVLASILGRRTQAFNVVSTPIAQKPPKSRAVSKRPRLLSRATPKRRKVELDSMAVLHGDVIRQQLASADDIRRERRKAPCTRREVWGFLRECEGQENFDEPTLPEISSDLLDLYHDVLHGHESRPRPLTGAAEAKQAALEAVREDCSELDNAEDTDLLAHYVKRISMKDACPSEAVGTTENLLPENTAKQVSANEDACLNQGMGNVETCLLDKGLELPKGAVEDETAVLQNPFGGLMQAGGAETVRAEEPSAIEVGTEVLDRKEGQAVSFPDAEVKEDTRNKDVMETRTEEQGAQGSELQRELETLLVSGFSEGDTSRGVVDQGVVQQDIVGMEEQDLPSVDLDKQASHEGEIVSPKEDANSEALCIPSGGKDAALMPVYQATGVDIGDTEEEEVKTTKSVVFEEETHQHSNDEEMAAAEPEGDTDFLDDDNDVAYAEIDYSSDEQDVSIQDDSGWSTRSRNVGKYLKTVFQEMESSSKRLDQRATLGLERLLARRTRREAARMFFETLVLKTKDYIHVEQNVPFQEILLYPNTKLMKTEF
ncbi:hypothetical protein GOP47_0014737 [Adiantum capillus-veneris]|uniref:Sister chromatid cohesion 1 protein 3 n=1 Tax=Adiantum capillus-veneris TaxID=13818 RepID=A0A9D4UML7_ADICA|nr:hypothetical protein GOP47_0014737 [Adiantum capillus-veneris]